MAIKVQVPSIAIPYFSFLLILIAVLGAFTPSTKSTDTKRYELSENSNPQGFDSNTLSATPTASNSSIFSSESLAEEHVKKIIFEKYFFIILGIVDL